MPVHCSAQPPRSPLGSATPARPAVDSPSQRYPWGQHFAPSPKLPPSALRYDLSKLRAKGLVERIGKTRRYRLTPLGLKLGVLPVKLRMRLLGPLATLIYQPNTNLASRRLNSVDAAYREVDTALDHLSAALGLQLAA